MEFFKQFISIVTAGMIGIGSWFGFIPESQILPQNQIVNDVSLGAFNTTGGKSYRLKASVGISDTTVNLSSFKEPVSNIAYTMAYINTTIGYGTLDPQIPDKSEFVSFTGITQNSDGSAALTGVTRGLTRTPAGASCTASTTLAVRHPAQSIFIISDSPCLFAEYAVKQNDESISGSWTFLPPTNALNPATKTYVDNLVNGGAVSTDTIVVAATAGETVASVQILFFNKFTAKWNKADADVASTSRTVVLGVAQGAGTDTTSISGGVLLKGLDGKNTGGTPGVVIFISNNAGATSTSAGTVDRAIGVIRNASSFYFDPSAFTANVEANGKINDNLISTTTILASNTFGPGTDGDVIVAALSTTTLTRDMYYNNLTVNGSIVTGGWRVFVKDTVSGTGNFTATGTPGQDGGVVSPPLGPGAGAATTTGFFISYGGANGGTGGQASKGNGSIGSSTMDVHGSLSVGRSGTGGVGVNASGGTPGTGAVNGTTGRSFATSSPYGLGTLSVIFDALVMSTTSNSLYRLTSGPGGSGGGGGGANSNNGGGGGGGGATGNIALIAAKTFAGSFIINAGGGKGGDATSVTGDGGTGGSGGGGKGGFGIRVYSTDTWSGSCSATGGAAGAGSSAGTAGANGFCVAIDINNLLR